MSAYIRQFFGYINLYPIRLWIERQHKGSIVINASMSSQIINVAEGPATRALPGRAVTAAGALA